MLVSQQIPALYNGVSQQPATIRSPGQCEAQVNAWATIVDGLQKRPPSEFVAKLTDALPQGAYLHDINRDVTERYVVVVTDRRIRVFDLLGNEKEVVMTGSDDYLDIPDGASPQESFALTTVADYTFVVNKTKTVELAPVGADQLSQSQDAWWLNRPNEGSATGAQKIQYQPNPTQSNVTPAIVQAFEKLPETAPHGALYEIRGNSESDFVSYYVRREGAVWNETVRPGLRNMINPLTMPHALVRRGDGRFEFGPFSWAPRRVGDEYTNPHPTFVGRQIRDVFFYKNRLGFCVDENAVLSRAGDFGVFHRMTVLDVLADDVVDVAASTTKVTKFNFAVPFQSGLMLFSDQTQFKLNHAGVVSPMSMSLDVTTQYEMSTSVRPAPLGSDVYFSSEGKGWATLREYYVRDDTENTDAGDVTAHVPRYIPQGVTRIIPSSDHDVVCVLTRGAKQRIYVYKFYWASADEKAQSAWSYWEMTGDDNILTGTILDGSLYLVISRADGVYLERISLDSGTLAPGLPFQVYLDRRAEVGGTYLPGENLTEFVLPFGVRPEERSKFRLVVGNSPGQRGALVNTESYEWHPAYPNVMRVTGNYAGRPMFAGMAYEFRYTFSEQFIKNSQQVPVTTGRLQLRTMTVYYVGTSFFRTEVAPYGVNPDIETIIPAKLADFTGKTLGDSTLLLGEPAFHEGSYSFQIYGNSDVAKVSLTNDSHLACNFQAAEWEGFYQNRARFR